MSRTRVFRLRVAAVFSLASFLVLNFLFLSHRSLAADYAGIPWHFGLLLLIAMVEAPNWARAMGFAWVALEFIVSGASIHGFPPELTTPIRFGGAHLCTALWVAGALYGKPIVLQVVGVGLVLIHLATCLLPIPVSMPLFFAMFSLTFLWVALLGWAGERVLGMSAIGAAN